MKTIMITLGVTMALWMTMAIADEPRTYTANEQQFAVSADQAAFDELTKAKDVLSLCDNNYAEDKDKNISKGGDIVLPQEAIKCQGKDSNVLDLDTAYSDFRAKCLKKTNGSPQCP